MTERVTVAVTAFDPISRAGIASQLRFRQEVQLVDADDGVVPQVAIVVVDRVDDQAAQTIRAAQRSGGARVVVVASQVEGTDLLAAVEAGCCGLLRRTEASPERLITAIDAAAAGDGTLPPDLLGRLMAQVGRLQRDALAPRGLTPVGMSKRELHVLRLVAEGHATSHIARELSYSERTVKNIIHDVTTRLQLRNRAQAVAYAVREGLI
jgi:DNA-binding NarL/FixJ family response regulator